MEGYLQTAVGLLVSLVLFFTTYRQTLGARRQRAILANAELRRAVLRRMVLESYQPTPADMERLARGKARLHRIPFELMDPAGEALTDTFATIFDNDLIPAQDRETLEKRIVTALEQVPDPEKEKIARPASQSSSRAIYVAAILAASLIGATATVFVSVVQTGTVDRQTLVLMLFVFIVSVLLTTAAVWIRRLSDKAETTPPSVLESVEVFKKVREALQASGINYTTFVGNSAANSIDYVIDVGDKKVGIEAMDANSPAVLNRTRSMLLPIVKEKGLAEVWVVTRRRMPEAAITEFKDGQAKFVSLAELRDKLSELLKAPATEKAPGD